MARRSTLGKNNPLDRIGAGPLDFIDAPKGPEGRPEPPAEPELKMLGVRLPVELHRRVKARAVEEGTTVQELSTRLYREYLDP